MPSTAVVFFLYHDLVRVWLLPAQEVLNRCNPLRFHRLETHVAYSYASEAKVSQKQQKTKQS
jgi:hypothetical protein